jgi:hypothetical protein
MVSEESNDFGTATVNGYTVRETASDGVTDQFAELFTPSLSIASDNVSNKKLIMGMNISVAFSDVVASLILQGSHDEDGPWITLATISSDTTPNVTGVKGTLVDLTNIYVPFFRFSFNSELQRIATSGRTTIFFANPA